GHWYHAAQSFVLLSGHFHPRNRFLTDVTAFFVIDSARFQVRFHRNDFGGQFAAPSRNSLLESKYFRTIVIAKTEFFRQLLQNIVARLSQNPDVPSGDSKTVCRSNTARVFQRGPA